MLKGIMQKSTNHVVYISDVEPFQKPLGYAGEDFIVFDLDPDKFPFGYYWDGTQVLYNNNYIEEPSDAKNPIILDLVEIKRDHRIINYKTELFQTLYPVRIFNQGELTNIKWYLEDTLQTLIIDVSVVYTRDVFNFVQYRVTTRTWYNNDGTANDDTKITIKHYDPINRMRESKKRRDNNILNMQNSVIGYMVGTIPGDPLTTIALGETFMAARETEISKYIRTGNDALVTSIQAATDSWLDNIIPGNVITIRDYIIQELTL